jgi:hypothetical protein
MHQKGDANVQIHGVSCKGVKDMERLPVPQFQANRQKEEMTLLQGSSGRWNRYL